MVPAEFLWGEGFLIPCGPVQLRELIRPLHLRKGTNALDLAAGVGGPARFIVRETGAWVVGLERRPDIASVGMAASESAGLGRQAPIRAYYPADLKLAPAAFEAAYGLFATWEVVERERFLRAVAEGLARGGRLLLVEPVQRAPAGKMYEAWRSALGDPPALWTREQYADCLRSAGFGIHFAIDVSAAHRAQIREGLRRLAQRIDHLSEDALSAKMLADIAAEAHRWKLHGAAIDEGGLGLATILAVR